MRENENRSNVYQNIIDILAEMVTEYIVKQSKQEEGEEFNEKQK